MTSIRMIGGRHNGRTVRDPRPVGKVEPLVTCSRRRPSIMIALGVIAVVLAVWSVV